MSRPPPRDQPSPEETARLVAELRAAVQAADRLAASTVLASPDRGRRQVRVLPEGARTRLTHVEHGQVLAERDVDTAWLIAHLGREGQSYAVLARVLTDPEP